MRVEPQTSNPTLPTAPNSKPLKMPMPKGIRQTRSGRFEVTVVHKMLPEGRASRTFETLESAARFREMTLAHLTVGSIPADVAKQAVNEVTLGKLIESYLVAPMINIAKSDVPTLRLLKDKVGAVKFSDVGMRWVEAWVKEMKQKDRIAPGTIRKRVESLARAMEWWHRTQKEGELLVNPLRQLPHGYSSYGDNDCPPEQRKEDVERDRRLHPGEQERIEATLNGWRNTQRQRPLSLHDAQQLLMFVRLLADTGLRLREAYRLQLKHIKFDRRVIHVERSKTGAKRDIPIKRELATQLREFLESVSAAKSSEDPVFMWWNGTNDEAELAKISSKLSGRLSTVFDYSGIDDLNPHDLRHEATCRWMELQDSKGRWMFRPEEVMKITGHKSVAMFHRYLSMRGSDLADRLWGEE